ncbi:beta-1,4-N-acetylgalactosaminyltransferase bre-4-like [Penaeus monodon]|uniref:beta-1,4-N-acetylgalactosaminyltransferase bre-4-like n=1 Tax=Penaeus monodon TaxID=6687 RepID=UPI0018A78911|nr:beta-1,4-N-acetylgalactosaminyltransferase bre-4-like [Penaeus monodon]
MVLLCSKKAQGLYAHVKSAVVLAVMVVTTWFQISTNDKIAKLGPKPEGGSWWPRDCVAPWRVAIVVPFRDREAMMGPFLSHMHPFLQRQLLNYTIYIVEQTANKIFNKAKLLNIGYKHAQAEGPWDCYAFHDVDCIPEDDRNLYYCSSQPRHLAVGPDKFNYKWVLLRWFRPSVCRHYRIPFECDDEALTSD